MLTTGTGFRKLRWRSDLIILDIILPGEFDGYEVCRRIRSFSRVPIIMLTARAWKQTKFRI